MKNSIRLVLAVMFVTTVAQSAFGSSNCSGPPRGSWKMIVVIHKRRPGRRHERGLGKPTYAVSKVTGGQKIHVKLQETIYHPGHYRFALAVNSPTELPHDPEVTTRDTERGPQSVSATIQNPPQIPVLADGLFVHSTRPEAAKYERKFNYRTSTARSARCRLCSSWPSTGPTTPAVIRIITAPTCKLPPIRKSRWIKAGPPKDRKKRDRSLFASKVVSSGNTF